MYQIVAVIDRVSEGPLLVQIRVRLFQVTLQSLRADNLPITHRAYVQEEVLPDMSGEGTYLGCSVVTEQASKRTLRPMDQQVALALELVLKSSVTGGTVVQELSEALTSL